MTTREHRQINEKIAEWFEPKPEQLPQTSHQVSERGAWKCKFLGFIPPPFEGDGTEEPKFEWRALDFDTDETANAMLRHAMLQSMWLSEWYKHIDEAREALGFSVTDIDSDQWLLIQLHAFCKFAGIEI